MKDHITLMLEYLSEAKNECVGAMITLCLWFSHKVRKPSGVLVLYLSTNKKKQTVKPFSRHSLTMAENKLIFVQITEMT